MTNHTETFGDRLLTVAADLELLAGHVDGNGLDLSTGNRALVQRFLDAVEAGDLDSALTCCRPEIRYTIPGRGSASGDHVGHEAVRLALQPTVRPGTEALQFLTHGVVGSGSPIISYHEVLAGIDGTTARYRMLLLFGFTAGGISEIHEFTDDQYLADDLFDQQRPEPDSGGWRGRIPFGKGRR